MKKICVLSVLTAFLWSVSFAQNHDIDSAKQELSITRQDTTRVIAMIWLCNRYNVSNTDSAMFYGQEALKLAREINFKKGEIRALAFISKVQNTIGDLPSALSLAFESLKLAQTNQLPLEAKWPFIFISEVYSSLNNYPNALFYRLKSLGIAKEVNDKSSMRIEQIRVGIIYEQMNQLDSASFYLKQVYPGFHQANEDIFTPSLFIGLARIQTKLGNKRVALNYYDTAAQLANRQHNHFDLSLAFINAAMLYKALAKSDSSIHYAIKALAEAKVISQKKGVLDASNLLAQLYEKNDLKESLRYYKMASAIKDSLYGLSNILTLQNMIAREEQRQKEIESSKLAYHNQLKQYAFLTGLVMVVLIAFLLYRNNRQKQKANSLLYQQKEEIQSAFTQLKATQSQLIQSEKMASLGELTAGIAHEIQNPLNFVNNFSEVNKELLAEMKYEIDKGNLTDAKDIANDVIENEDKINHHGKRADAIVKSMLQHSRSSSGVKEPTDINALADEYLRLAYHGLRAKDKSFNASMITDFDSSIGTVNLIPQDMGRVILNLITNAFYVVYEKKKQMGEGYEPTVSIRTKKKNGRVEIIVKDNGNGIPAKVLDKIFQPFFTTKPTGLGTGLGLSLSYDIVKAHGGEIKVTTKENEGTEFIIQLPANNA